MLSRTKMQSCPNCGCECPQLLIITWPLYGYYVQCPICNWTAGAYRMRWKAIKKWNGLHFGGIKDGRVDGERD